MTGMPKQRVLCMHVDWAFRPSPIPKEMHHGSCYLSRGHSFTAELSVLPIIAVRKAFLLSSNEPVVRSGVSSLSEVNERSGSSALVLASTSGQTRRKRSGMVAAP